MRHRDACSFPFVRRSPDDPGRQTCHGTCFVTVKKKQVGEDGGGLCIWWVVVDSIELSCRHVNARFRGEERLAEKWLYLWAHNIVKWEGEGGGVGASSRQSGIGEWSEGKGGRSS